MGIIKQGILGGFSGKVGTVIGTFWKGRNVMRSIANHVHNPNTPAQQASRARFALVSSFLSSTLAFVNVGYRHYASTESQFDAAVRDNLAKAVTGSGTSVSLDYDKVSLSKGLQLNVGSPAVAVGSNHSATVTWTDNSGYDPSAISSDPVMICLYDEAHKASTSNLSSASREDGTLSVNYPASWAGDTIQVFIATRSLDDVLTSNTVKVGTFVAA